MTLYARARQNRERYLLYSQPTMMAERLLDGKPVPAGNHLPAARYDDRRRVGQPGNQNAGKNHSYGGR